VTPFLVLLGLACIFAGFILTAVTRARNLGARWESSGLWAIFGGFGLIMLGVVLAIATAG
jgi:uncharacterized membrane protein